MKTLLTEIRLWTCMKLAGWILRIAPDDARGTIILAHIVEMTRQLIDQDFEAVISKWDLKADELAELKAKHARTQKELDAKRERINRQ